jgi:hypothetical protein
VTALSDTQYKITKQFFHQQQLTSDVTSGLNEAWNSVTKHKADFTRGCLLSLMQVAISGM